MWRPIETLPPSGQALVTDDDLPNEPGDGYGTIELVVCPMLADGRVLNQNSGNYTRAGVWKWWAPVPPRNFEDARIAELEAQNADLVTALRWMAQFVPAGRLSQDDVDEATRRITMLMKESVEEVRHV